MGLQIRHMCTYDENMVTYAGEMIYFNNLVNDVMYNIAYY